jgi:hypothetical protein
MKEAQVIIDLLSVPGLSSKADLFQKVKPCISDA